MKYLIMLLLFASCVNQKSVARWIKNNPDKTTIDSVFVVDTLEFITQRVETDTIFSIHRKDTMVIHKENLTIRTYFRNDSIYVYGECESDTVTIIQDRWVGNKIGVNETKGWSDWVPVVCCLVILVVSLFRRR